MDAEATYDVAITEPVKKRINYKQQYDWAIGELHASQTEISHLRSERTVAQTHILHLEEQIALLKKLVALYEGRASSVDLTKTVPF